MTTGTTTGFTCLMMAAVPLRPGANGRVVPCGNVITQLSSSALYIFLVSEGSRPFLTSLPCGSQVRFTVSAPASANMRLIQLPFMVSSAAT